MKSNFVAGLLGSVIGSVMLLIILTAVSSVDARGGELDRSAVSISGSESIATLQASTRYIAKIGSDAGTCSNTVSPCSTVQYAIDQAADGDAIHIAAGMYTSVTLRVGTYQHAYITKTLMIQGGYTTTDNFAASNPNLNPTILDAQSGGRVLYINGVAGDISNLTLQNGNITGSGGGIFASSGLTLTSVQVISNTASGTGGGVFVGAAATINGGTFQRNLSLSNSGGALFISGPLAMTNALVANNASPFGSGAGLRAASTATISGSQFISNTAVNPGGGIRVNLAITLTNSTFMSNTSGESGGGLRANANATIIGGSFIANTADEGGGAFVPGITVLTGTLFSRNVALFRGGGLDAVTATIRSATFDGNQTLAGNGGGLSDSNVLSLTSSLFTRNAVLSGTQVAATGSGGGLLADGVMTSTGNTFFGNFAYRLGGGADADKLTSTSDQFRGNWTGPQGSGGGLFVNGVLKLDGGLFYTNTANTAGGLGVNSTGSGSVVNSLFARNVVTFTDGGSAMRLLSTSNMFLAHNTIVGISQPSRAAIHLQSNGSFSFYANIFSQHTAGIKNFGILTPTEDYNLFFTVTTKFIGPMNQGSQSFTADPRFVNPAADDFHLAFASPAIDAAFSFGLSRDFEGQVRPMGNNYDIGFDEALPPRIFIPLILK